MKNVFIFPKTLFPSSKNRFQNKKKFFDIKTLHPLSPEKVFDQGSLLKFRRKRLGETVPIPV
jgi:hypothetical protein